MRRHGRHGHRHHGGFGGGFGRHHRRHHHRHHHHNNGLGVGLGLGILAGATMAGSGSRIQRRRNNQRTIVVQQPAPVIVQQQQLPPPGHQLMAVQCPANVYENQPLNVITPNGMMRITVPQGVVPGQRFHVLVPMSTRPVQAPIQATYVQQPQSYQPPPPPPQPTQQTLPPPPSYQQQQQQQVIGTTTGGDASVLIPDMVRMMVRNGRDYLEIRNAVKNTIAPTLLTQEHKNLIRQTIATEQNQMGMEQQQPQQQQQQQQQSSVPTAPVSYAQVVQPVAVQQSTAPTPNDSTTALKPVAKQLIIYGYDYETSVAAADRCSTVESAMDWISHQGTGSGVTGSGVTGSGVTGSGGGGGVNSVVEPTTIGREGRRSFSDAMMPTAPPLF